MSTPSDPNGDEKKEYRTCPACHGRQVQYSQKSGLREECPMCEGEGKILTKKARHQRYLEHLQS